VTETTQRSQRKAHCATSASETTSPCCIPAQAPQGGTETPRTCLY